MFRMTIKSLLSRRTRLVLSGLSIVLGVLFVTASVVFMNSAQQNTVALYADRYRDVDAVVELSSVEANPEGERPLTTITSDVAATVSRQPGVRRATGVIEVPGVRIIGRDGKVLDNGAGVHLGTAWRGDDGFRRIRSGRAPTGDDEVALSVATAQSAHTQLGQPVTLLTEDLERRSFVVVGLYGYRGGRDSLAAALEAAFTTGTAQRLLLGQADRFTSVHVTAAPGTRRSRLRSDLAAAVGRGYRVSTGSEYRDRLVRRDSQGRQVFTKILLGFAGVSLAVGALLIFNTFSILVTQRTREWALLRTLGASRRQIITAVLAESAIVGTAGAVVGVACGIGVSAALVAVVSRLAGGDFDLYIPPIAVVAAIAVGVPVTVLACLAPAVTAARIPPVAAMRQAAVARRSGVLTTLLVPFRVVGWVLGRSVTGRLGWRNAMRNPRRTVVTATALTMGMMLTTGMSIVVASADESLRGAADRDVKVSLMVHAPGGGMSRISPAAVDRIRKLAGVAAAVGERIESVTIAIPGRRSPITEEVDSVTDLASTASMYSLRLTSGRWAPEDPTAVVVDTATARRYHLHAGSVVTMTFSGNRSARATVSGIVTDSAFFPSWVAGPALATAYYTTDRPSSISVRTAKDASVVSVQEMIEPMFAADPTVRVDTLDDVIAAQSAKFDQMLLAVQGLLGLAILIAILGVVNTLALSIIERTRELGILRAVGMRREQITRMITAESVAISVVGGLFGLIIGTGLGLAAVRLLAGQGITTTAIPTLRLAAYLVVAVIIGVLAAVVPARRAARIDVLSAIAHPE